MSYRPLTITSPLYRCWAAMRLQDMAEWVEFWQLEEMYAGVAGRGATDAWHEALVEIEAYKLNGTHCCGAVADIAKFFDQIRRGMVAKLARMAGMPEPVADAYERFLEDMEIHNCVGGGIGKGHKRKCGIPQGCPFSMAMVALIMRPWIILMRTCGEVRCFILADDVLILAK